MFQVTWCINKFPCDLLVLGYVSLIHRQVSIPYNTLFDDRAYLSLVMNARPCFGPLFVAKFCFVMVHVSVSDRSRFSEYS